MHILYLVVNASKSFIISAVSHRAEGLLWKQNERECLKNTLSRGLHSPRWTTPLWKDVMESWENVGSLSGYECWWIQFYSNDPSLFLVMPLPPIQNCLHVSHGDGDNKVHALGRSLKWCGLHQALQTTAREWGTSRFKMYSSSYIHRKSQ